jgi:hypothetical protein
MNCKEKLEQIENAAATFDNAEEFQKAVLEILEEE